MSIHTPGRYTEEQIRKVEKLQAEAESHLDRLNALAIQAEAILEIDTKDGDGVRWDDGWDAIWNLTERPEIAKAA